MSMIAMNNCPFGYNYVVCGDSMMAEVWCGVHFLYFVELA